MKRFLALAIAVLTLAAAVPAQTAPDAAELTKLLNDFLAGASRNDAAMHDRFWAEDLMYTGSTGRRRGKAEIMRSVRSAPAPKPGDPVGIYSAEDIRIQQYGSTAIVAFRLVGTTEKDGKKEVLNFLNSGTFLKREGKWQVVSWQATRMPRAEEESKADVAAGVAAFHQAMLAGDVKKLEALLDETFIWTHRTGEQMPRKELLDDLASGHLKYSKLETEKLSVAVYGDTAVARGVSPRQRSSIPATPGTGDAAPFTSFFTLTFTSKGGAWVAVALHTSRP
ncbi:MAG: nuclear transport factor 2 family protein [Acidobacteria bacterium]|nr:nuclear transport factor 2 family protein [Acidobacteriota bacterium]MCL5288434.1 nuclear transport factor 2 family protein [Acidobacteriota bacterium]